MGTTKSHPLGELYKRYALSPLIEIVEYLSHDFVARPQLYANVSSDVRDILEDFRFKLGKHPKWPNAFQRTLNFKIIGAVNLAGPPLRAAALACAQSEGEKSQTRLLESFTEACSAFREELEGLDGSSLRANCDQICEIFDSAVTVLQDAGVANAYGCSPAPAKNWPLQRPFSGSAAGLIEEILNSGKRAACMAGAFRRLSDANPRERPLIPQLLIRVPRTKFLALQQAAYFGGSTISAIVSPSEEPHEVGDLVSTVYGWTLALQRLIPDPARAWTDLDYRSRLTDLEWGLAPNPVGDARPKLLGPRAGGVQTDTIDGQRCCSSPGATKTISGEICCNSGDLDCDPTAILTDFCTEFCTIA